jgi:hypothetical protein
VQISCIGEEVVPQPHYFTVILFARQYLSLSLPIILAGWRMASTAMRLAILAACADTFYVLIDGRHFEPPLP